jgi:hypothetical protein
VEGTIVIQRDCWSAFVHQLKKVREAARALDLLSDTSTPQARAARALYRSEIDALKPAARSASDRLIIARLESEARLSATYYVSIAAGKLEPSRSRPDGPLAFTFQGPDFETQDDLHAHFEARFFPLRVVFEDERGREHVSDDRLSDYVEGRMLMSTVASMRIAEGYDERMRASRAARVRRVRLLTKDGRKIDERDAAHRP